MPCPVSLKWLTMCGCVNHLGLWLATQVSSAFYFSGIENDYWPKCTDTLQLGNKGRYGSFHLSINVWWQAQLCDPLLTRAIPECFRDELLMIKRYKNPLLLFFTLLTLPRVKVMNVQSSMYWLLDCNRSKNLKSSTHTIAATFSRQL